MEAVPEYRLHSRQKALAICVKWPETEGQPVFIDAAGAFALADQSDGKFTPGAIVAGALRDCQGAQAQGQHDCTCQIMDVSGSNRLVVPETIPSPNVVISTRRSEGPNAGPSKKGD